MSGASSPGSQAEKESRGMQKQELLQETPSFEAQQALLDPATSGNVRPDSNAHSFGGSPGRTTCFGYLMKIFDLVTFLVSIFMKVVFQPLLVVFATVIGYYLVKCDLFYAGAILWDSHPVAAFFLNFVTVFLAFNAFFNYYATILIRPSKTSPAPPFHYPEGYQWTVWCPRCLDAKAPRAHHCSMCGKCVPRMDHHCPWVTQCVHEDNHRFFVLFLTYTTLLFAFSYFYLMPFINTPVVMPSSPELPFVAVLMVNICLFIGAAVLFLAVFHLYLAATNQTTIEIHANKIAAREAKCRGEAKYVHPFDRGLGRNLAIFFGYGSSNVLLWFLPMVARRSKVLRRVEEYDIQGENLV